eukprot:SAG11_NODE_259_length_11534_cov_3.402361_5_plen_223_part_00
MRLRSSSVSRRSSLSSNFSFRSMQRTQNKHIYATIAPTPAPMRSENPSYIQTCVDTMIALLTQAAVGLHHLVDECHLFHFLVFFACLGKDSLVLHNNTAYCFQNFVNTREMQYEYFGLVCRTWTCASCSCSAFSCRSESSSINSLLLMSMCNIDVVFDVRATSIMLIMSVSLIKPSLVLDDSTGIYNTMVLVYIIYCIAFTMLVLHHIRNPYPHLRCSLRSS